MNGMAEKARAAGFSFGSICAVLDREALTDVGTRRRLRLWRADCAAHVLHIYEAVESGRAPHNAIAAYRKYARGDATAADQVSASFSAWAAASKTNSFAAYLVATAAASTSAGAAVMAVASSQVAERAWQFDRLISRMSGNEPDDWPLSDP